MLDHQYLYFPEAWDDSQDWRAVSGLPLEEVWLTTRDGVRLFGWYLEHPASPGVLLWCHGNAGNIIHRLDNLAGLYRRGLSALLFDYRGYGRSEGTASEEGLYQDGLAAWAYLAQTRDIPPSRIVTFGRSLGAAVAGEIAAQRKVAGLILESAFPSVEAVARWMFSGFPAHLALKARFPLADRLRQVRVPVLVLHGDRDETIPFQFAEAVYEAAQPPKRFHRIEGAGHNDTVLVGGEAYYQELLRFIREVTAKEGEDVPQPPRP